MTEDERQQEIARIDAEIAKLEGGGKSSKGTSLEMDPAIENIVNVAFPFALSPAAIKAAAKLAKKAAHKIKDFVTPDKLSRLKHNPELKKKVIEELAETARPARFGNVPNQVAGEKAIKSAENYKKKQESTFNNVFERAKEYLNKHITGPNRGNRFIDSTEAEMFAINKLLKLESPTLQVEFMKGPLGKQLQKLLKVKREGRKLTIDEAEHMRREIGNLNSTAGAIGTGSQGELRGLSGHLKKEILGKYAEAGPQAARHISRANKHYTLHKEKNVPKVNKTLELKHEPEEAFSHSIKGINKGASNLKHTLQYLKGKDKRTYAKGIIFELGKKGDEWSPTNYYKNYSEIPSGNKKILMSSIGEKEAARLKALEQELKTMDALGGRKSGLEIAGEFAPYGIKKWMHPIKAARQNNYLTPKNVSEVTEAVKRKAHPSPVKASKDKSNAWDTRIVPGLISGLNNAKTHDELEDIERQIAELEGR